MTRVFVSSTYTDLIEHRQAVSARIRQLGAVDVAREYLGARDERPKDECIRLVRQESDIFIGIYAHRYGTIPVGETKSITELEYIAASNVGIKRLIYIADDNIPWLKRFVDQGAQAKLLEDFKAALKSSHVVKYFSNKDNLAASVAADLGRELAFSLYRKVDPGKGDGRNPKSIDDWNNQRVEIYKNNNNVFLAHTLRPSAKPGQTYDIAIYLIPHHSNDPKYYREGLEDIVGADFYMGPQFGSRVIRVRNNGGRIGIVTSAFGPFLCICRVQFRDGTRTMLQRYIDFESGPHLRTKSRRTRSRRKAIDIS